MADPAKVSARAVAPIVGALRAVGADVQGALDKAQLDLHSVLDPEARVLHERVVHLWSIATEMSGDPDLGLRASGLIEPGQFGVVEYALRKSATLFEGFQRASRYFRIGHDVARLDVAVEGEHMLFEHTLPGARTLPRSAADFVLSNPVLIVRDATVESVSPVEVWVDYAPPDDVTALEERFRAPVRFLRGRRAVLYAAADADARLLQSEPGLCALLDAHAKQLLETLPTIGTFSDRVRELLARELAGGDPTAQGMARALDMSVRTLHRRLTDEGTTHKQLLEQLRRELADRYLRDRAIAIAEVAYLLGFSEPSAFHRAFRRWTRQTPAEFRAAK